jgi:hypothetical protein
MGLRVKPLSFTYARLALMPVKNIEVLAQQLGHKDKRISIHNCAHLCPTFKRLSVRHNALRFGFGSDSQPSLAP